MIPDDQIEAWTELYDLGHRNFDDQSVEARKAWDLLHQLQESYRKLGLGSISFDEFRRAALKRIIARLKTPPPTL